MNESLSHTAPKNTLKKILKSTASSLTPTYPLPKAIQPKPKGNKPNQT